MLPALVDGGLLKIVLVYNAEMRGLANYYRPAYCAKFSLRKLHFLWQTSLLKTVSFKLRRSVNQVVRHLKIGDRLAIRVKVEDGKGRLVEVFALKDLARLPELGTAVERFLGLQALRWCASTISAAQPSTESRKASRR